MKLPLYVLASGLLATALPVNAADPGFYIGAGAGQVTTEADDIFGTGFDFDEDDFGFKLFGGYRFFPWLSVEGIYLDGGSPEVRATEGSESASLGLKVQSLVAAAVFSLPIGDSFELFLKPGYAYWDSETSLRYSSASISENATQDDNGGAFFIGGGAGWDNGNAGLRLEYEWFDWEPEFDGANAQFDDELDASTGFLSLSVVYRFQ